MGGEEFGALVATWGIWILLPLAVIEGPVVAVLAGVMAGKGLIAAFPALVVLVVGDVVGDCILYAIGRGGARGVTRYLPQRMRPGRRLLPLVRGFRNRGWQLLVAGKLTHAAGFAVLLAAGAARMRPGLFLAANLGAAIPKAAALVALGWLAGSAPGWLAESFALAALALGAVWLLRIVTQRRRIRA